MKFLELLQRLESHLGYHQIPVNERARSLKDLFESSPVHHDLITCLVRAIYEKNACRTLNDPLSRDATFNALTPIRQRLLNAASTDVDTYHTMEEVCAVIGTVFSDESAGAPSRQTGDRGRHTAKVIDLTPVLRSRRVRSWA